MPEENKAKTKPKKTKSSMVGSVAKPTVLSDDPKIGIDTAKTFVDNIIDAGVNGGLNISDLESFTTISNARDKIYQLIDTMSQDSTVAAIVKTYAEDVCAVADNGHVMWCESDEPNISKYVNYLLNVMNVDKNLYKWAYCLIKYGDVYLRLYRESDYEDSLFSKDSVNSAYSAKNVLNEDYKKELDEAVRLNMHSASDPYSYYVEMVDDPSSMYELDKYGKTYGYIETPNAELAHMSYLESINQDPNVTYANYRFKSGDVNIYQADDFVHACLDDNFTRYPEKVSLFVSASDFDTNTNAHSYSVKRGKSLLYDSYKVWREKSLLENSVLLNRITRSSILRKVSVEVGDMPKEQVSQVLHRVKDMMENKTAMNKDVGMSEYNNAAPIENFIYFATHNGQGAITVDSVGGDVNVKDLADLDTWINKFYSSYGIPKQYFG